MKQFFKMMMFIVAATMAFAACSQQYEDETQISAPTIKVTATMLLEATRSSFGEPDGKIYPTEWDGNEKMKYSLNFGDAKDVEPTFVDDQSATAELTLTDDGSGSYTIHALSPASAYLSVFASDKKWNVTVPATQTPSATSCDPAAQILYGVSNTSDVLDGSYTLSFHHALAYGKMTLKNLALNGAKISSVAITTDSDIAGRHYVYPSTGETAVNVGAKSITIITDTDENIWFACAPVAFTELKVTVTTDKGIFIKTISASKAFKSGKIAVFAIDMAGVEAEKPVEYQLLTNVADLNIGDQVIIANTENAAAMSSTQNGNNRSKDAVTIENGCIVAPGDGVEIFVVEEGTKANTYAFLATKTEGYIYAASSEKNYLRTETTLSDNSSWLITIADGATSIVAQGSNTHKTLQYNPSSNGGLFACYDSASQKPVDVYYLPSGNVPATPKISASDIADVPAEGVQNATADITLKNINGNVTVTKDGTVVTAASLSGETLTYTVSENTGAAREGWIKLAADGAECTIKVSQVANPDVAQTLPYEESFGSNQGLFTIENVNISSLNYVWAWASGYGMKASAYVNKIRHATEAWLVSPLISLEGATTPELTFDHVQRYAANAATDLTVWVSKNGGAWEQVTVPTYSDGNSWTFVASGAISLSKYVGSIIKVGFKYTSTTSDAATWEIKNFKVADGSDAPATTPLDTPEVTATAEGNTITVSWKAITGAKDYTVTCGTASKTVTGTSAEFTDLEYETKYDVTVVANPASVSTNTKSEAGTASATTEADPNAGGSGEGNNATDVINREFTGVSGSSYTEWTGTGTSGAVYAGQSSGDHESVQLRSKNNNSGIIVTKSAGKVSKVIVTWNSNTADGRTLNIYGKKSAYSAATDLYDNSKQGELLGTIVKGTSTELAIEGDYAFIGLRSASGAMYLTEIRVVWGDGGDAPAPLTPLATPVVTATAEGNTINVSWNTITGAKDYTVTCAGTSKTITGTSAEFTGLAYSTKYDVTVVANPENTTLYSASAPATKTITTGQNPNPGTGSGEDIELVFNLADYTQGISAYDKSWEHTYNGKTWSIANFNNNNKGWTYIKCGSKNGASVASIATTFPIATAVKSVKVTVDAVTASAVNSTYLVVASNASFSNIVETVNVTIKQGEVAYNITNPQANCYYKLVYDCAQTSKNGTVQISKVVYSAQ